jgi:hypothetical protein
MITKHIFVSAVVLIVVVASVACAGHAAIVYPMPDMLGLTLSAQERRAGVPGTGLVPDDWQMPVSMAFNTTKSRGYAIHTQSLKDAPGAKYTSRCVSFDLFFVPRNAGNAVPRGPGVKITPVVIRTGDVSSPPTAFIVLASVPNGELWEVHCQTNNKVRISVRPGRLNDLGERSQTTYRFIGDWRNADVKELVRAYKGRQNTGVQVPRPSDSGFVRVLL